MKMGMFDPDSFMSEMQDAEEISTKRLVIEPGVYPGNIADVKIKNGEKEGREWAGLDVTWEVDDENVKKALNRDVVKCHQQFFFDLDDYGKLEKGEGKNVDLGRLLKAVGLNGKAWSPAILIGQRALIHVKNTPVKDSVDGDVRSEVKGVAALV